MYKRLLSAIWIAVLLAAGAHAEQPESSALASMIGQLGLRESATASRDLPGWRKPTKVVAWLDSAERLPALRAAAPGVEVVMASDLDAAKASIASAQVVMGFCDQDLLAQGEQVHWVQVYSAGVENCVANPAMSEGNRVLTNGQRIGSPALAEHAIGLMLGLARGLDIYHAHQLNGEWNRRGDLDRDQFIELEGRTLLVVGLGGIGSQVAKRGHGLGMRVIATRNSRRSGPDYVAYVGLADELLKLAGEADVVINTAPLTDQTRGMFNAEFFAAMRPSAFFISVGRGASTVTDDLIAALKEGQIAGAGLDVTDPEPLPAGHPLWTTPRVLITPHTAGRSDRSRERLFLLVQENLRRYVAGEPLLSMVDIARGY